MNQVTIGRCIGIFFWTWAVCLCGGIWGRGAAQVLRNNLEPLPQFGRDVCRALAMGAKRGVNIAVIGAPGAGKSMLFEPLDQIFTVMGKPQVGSTFPLCNALDAEVLLWQDYEHCNKTLCFTDLLSFTVGEKMDIRIPGAKGHSFRNLSPLFFTANQPLTLKAGPVEDQLKKTKAMEERFVTRIWPRALPEQDRRPDFPQCGRCCANFLLSLDAFWHSNHAS